MKNLLLFTLLLVTYWNPLTAQDKEPSLQDRELGCGTEPVNTNRDTADIPWFGNNELLYETLLKNEDMLISDTPSDRSVNGGICGKTNGLNIPIRFWVWRENSSDNAIGESHLQDLIDAANGVFQANGLNFNFYTYCPEFPIDADLVDIEDSDELDELDDNGNNDGNAINVHIVKTGMGNGISWAGVYNGSDDFIAIRRSSVTSTRGLTETWPHELGHYFGLDHTHNHTEDFFQTGTACCKSEPVTRGKKWHEPCIGCIWVGIPWYNKRCSRTGDYLCDTEADPRGSHSSCTYTNTWTDGYGDTYHPSTSNIMSYYSSCRTQFTDGQKGLMIWQIIFKGNREFILKSHQNVVPTDEYEPDNTDEVEVPRLISIGETQCHSMSTVYKNADCSDSEDWLRIENENGLLGAYQVIVRDVDGFDNPVDDLKVFNTDNDGERTDEITVTFTDNGSERIWEIPCGAMEPNTATPDPDDFNDFLVQITRGSQDPGWYTVNLTTEDRLPFVKHQQQICPGESFTVTRLPEGATVSWSTQNLSLDTYSGPTVVVTNVLPWGPPYVLTATVTFDGCSYRIRREFSEVGGSSLPPIGNMTMQAVGPPCEPHFIFSIPTVPGAIHYSWDCSASPSNVEFNGCYGGNSTTAYADAYMEEGGSITIYVTVTASNDCGGTVTRSRGFTYTASGKDCDIHFNGGSNNEISLKISPNPVDASAFTLEILDDALTTQDYKILIINQFGKLEMMLESTEKLHQLSALDLRNGLYYAEVINASGVSTTTFLIEQ